MIDDREQAAGMYRLLGHGEHGLRELRALRRRGSPDVSYHATADGFADKAIELSRQDFIGVYTPLNPLVADFKPQPGRATSAHHIDRIRHIVFDHDPVRNHPKGGKVCASDAEHDAALEHAARFQADRKADGWPDPLAMDSGSGAYSIYAVDLPNTPESVALVKGILEAAASRYDTDKVHIDRSTFDPPRIVRVAGTLNKKSTPTKERPNRPALILASPEVLLPVSLEQLNAFAGTAIAPSEDKIKEVNLDALDALEEGDLREKITLLVAYCTVGGIPPTAVYRNETRHFAAIQLPWCPLRGKEHDDGRAGILVFDDGKIGFHCFHEKCSAAGWADVQQKLGSFREFIKEHAAGPARQFCDPLRFAEKHLKRWAMPDGTPTIAHFLNETYRYSQREGWVEVRNGELDAWIRDTIQREHDRHAVYMTKLEGKDVKPEPVAGYIVGETMRAMESVCRHAVSAKSSFVILEQIGV